MKIIVTRLLALATVLLPLTPRAEDKPQADFGARALAAALSMKTGIKDPGELEAKVQKLFGKYNLVQGRTGAKVDGTTVAWAVIAHEPASVVRGDGGIIGRMTPVGENGLQVLALKMDNFQQFNYRIEVNGMTKVAGDVHVEHFEYTEDSMPHAGVPKGRLEKFEWKDSKIFPNTVRTVTVYVPAQYRAGEEACLMVWQDGSRHADPEGQVRAPVVFDNLIHKGDMPVTIGVFIDPGRGPKQKPEDRAANRGFEYDSLGGAYATFLLDEILPEVEKRRQVKFKSMPQARAIGGGSSGGICSFTAAWERPDQFGKVLSWVGSFVDLRGGNAYPSMIRLNERKPIRVYLYDGENDLDNKFGNWPLANKMMAAALEYMGYDYTIQWGKCFHGSKGISASLPDALRWLWRDWKGTVAAK